MNGVPNRIGKEKDIMSMIAMTEESLQSLKSPRIKILASELRAIKDFIGTFVETSEKLIMEEPNLKQQMILERRGI